MLMYDTKGLYSIFYKQGYEFLQTIYLFIFSFQPSTYQQLTLEVY